MKSYRNKFVSAVRIHLIRAGLVSESVESFFLNLSNPSGGTIADGSGVGTIERGSGKSMSVTLAATSNAIGTAVTNWFITPSAINPSFTMTHTT